MNITLVNPPIPYKFEKTPYVPLGIGYLAAAIRAAYPDAHMRFIDGQIESESVFWASVEHLGTDVLLVAATIRQMKNAQRVASVVRRNRRETRVILGGPGPSGFPVMPATQDIDVVVRGEAEEILPCLISDSDIPPALAHVEREPDRSIVSVVRPPDVNAIPWPDRSIFDQDAYSRRWRETARMVSVSLIGSRGCPFQCIFCDHSVTGRGVRYRDVSNIAAEMVMLREKYLPDDVFFYDDLFTVKPSRVHALCELLRSSSVRVKWSAQGRVDCVTEEMLTEMREAGCTEVEFGVESGSNRILGFFRKGVTRDQIIRAFALCHKLGLNTGAYLIVGVPGETLQDILDKRG